MARNPNADRKASADAKRRMAYRAAVRLRIAGSIFPGMHISTFSNAIEVVHEETGCERTICGNVIQAAIRARVTPAPVLMPAIDLSEEDRQDFIASVRAAQTGPASNSAIWWDGEPDIDIPVRRGGGAIADAYFPQPKPAPAPQTFERPKRRIVLG